MTERPITFNSHDVNAILAGIKTHTRRPVKGIHCDRDIEAYRAALRGEPLIVGRIPVRVGDLLWVRETWKCEELPWGENGIRYRADDAFAPIADTRESADAWVRKNKGGKVWRPSTNMPRWASRITLEITSVGIEELWSITNEDALAEGVSQDECDENGVEPIDEFSRLWNERYFRNYPWAENPWVWVYGFKTL